MYICIYIYTYTYVHLQLHRPACSDAAELGNGPVGGEGIEEGEKRRFEKDGMVDWINTGMFLMILHAHVRINAKYV